MGTGPECRFDFPSAGRDRADGFAGYRQLYSLGTDVEPDEGRFRASVSAYRFHRLLVFDRSLNAVRHTRDTVRVRRDGFDHINIQLLLSGHLLGGALGEERLVSPGEVVLFDVTKPQRTVAHDARLIALSLPREQFERVMGIPAGLHGAVLPEAVGGLLADFIRSLVARGATLDGSAAGHAATVVAHLAAAALSGPGVRRPILRQDHLVQARSDLVTRHMERHLGDTSLDAGMVAAALGLSRSTLNRALAAQGGFTAHLLSLRLARMRDALRGEGGATVGAIAHAAGFASASHCSRAFRDRFGLPPGQWRERQSVPRPRHDRRDGGAGPETERHTFESLFQEVR